MTINFAKINISYLKQLGFEDIYDIAERYPLIFLNNHNDFISMVNKLFMSLGENYIFKLENNLSLWEALI